MHRDVGTPQSAVLPPPEPSVVTVPQFTHGSGSARPRLPAGLVVLRRRGDRIQLGCAPGRAVVVSAGALATGPATDPTSPLRALLAGLDGRRTVDEVCVRRRGGTSARRELRRLLDALLDAGALENAAADPAGPLRRLWLHGHGPLRAGVERGVRALGVPVTALPDRVPERPGPGTLAVFTDAIVVDPTVLRALDEARVPSLPVHLRDGDGIVGPLVVPGRTACPECLDLRRAEIDPDWPLLAAQLLGRAGVASRTTVQATVACALAQIELIAGVRPPLAAPATVGAPPPSLGATLQICGVGGRILRRPWAPVPHCRCARATRRDGAGSTGRE